MKSVIYARYSSHNQREESIEDQVQACEDAADARKNAERELFHQVLKEHGIEPVEDKSN